MSSSPHRSHDGIVVLHVSDYSAPYSGSFISQLRLLDEEMRRRGYGQCAYAFPDRAHDMHWFNALQVSGAWTSTIRSKPHLFNLFSSAEVTAMAAETGCAVVHSHFSTYDVAAVAAARAASGSGRRCHVIWHYRTALEEPVHNRTCRRRSKDWLKFRAVGGRIDRCVAVTEALAQEAAARGLGSRACSVRAGCDTDTFRPDPEIRAKTRANLGIRPDQILVLHLGWDWHRKGGDLLVEAATRLRGRELDDLVFISVGAPPKGLDQVKSLAFVENFSEVQAAADIFVSASRSEGFGNGLVEALASGSVAVAACVEGQRELFQSLPGCRTFPPGDAGALADCIESLLEDRSEWSNLGALNRRHVVQQLSMQTWAKNMVDLYEKVTDENENDPS